MKLILKRGNDIINKTRTKITSRCNSMLHLWKKNLKKALQKYKLLESQRYCHYTEKYRDVEHSIFNSKFNVPNESHVVFHNGSNDDYFIIKELANEFEGKFGENTKKKKKKYLFKQKTKLKTSLKMVMTVLEIYLTK